MKFKTKKSEILFHGRVCEFQVDKIKYDNGNKTVHENFLSPIHQ